MTGADRKAGIVMPYFIHPQLRRFENEFLRCEPGTGQSV